jgi:hypothetical protein
MKGTIVSIVGMVVILFTVSPKQENYPKVDIIKLNDTTIKEDFTKTALYIRTVQVEDTINETKKIIKEIKQYNHAKSDTSR